MSYYLRGTAFLLEPFAKHLVQVNFFKFMNKVTLKKGKLRIVFISGRSSRTEVFCGKSVFKNFAKFTKKKTLAPELFF